MIKTTAIDINAMRGEMIGMLYDTSDPSLLSKISKAINRCFRARAREENERNITEEEFDQVKESLAEYYEAKRTGRKMPYIEELINEL